MGYNGHVCLGGYYTKAGIAFGGGICLMTDWVAYLSILDVFM